VVTRAPFRRRPGAGRAALLLLASAAFLCLLFVPARDDDNLRLALDWRPEIEPLLLIGLLAGLALGGRRLPALLRWLLAVLILLAALLQAADAVVLGVFDRQLDLYFDLPHLPSLLALFAATAGPWHAIAAATAVLLAAAALVALIARAIAASERALRPPRHAAAVLVLVLLLAAAAPLVRLAEPEPVLAARTTPVVLAQAARLWRAFRVMHGYDARYAAALAAPQPPPGALPGLKRRDVYLVFFESYGTVVLDEPRYAAVVAPALAQFAATVGNAGWHLLSSRIVSPTFGGGSWLAHGTIDSGFKLDPLLTRLVTGSRRETLPRYMRAAGYRSIEVMPGIKTPEPEHGFWGFDRSFYAADLGYDGPPFGWFSIPDQYTLDRLDRIEGAPGHAPLFAQIVLVSSHTPFAPVPPYVADWDAAPLYGGIPQAEWDRIYAAPDWAHLETPYLASIVYDLRTLGAWLARLPGDALVVIVGDHQPPSFIAGEKQPWTVPIHVLSRDPALLRPFQALGYVEGALPPRAGAARGMESFLGDFIAGFASPPAAVAAGRDDAGEHGTN
jgi:hypothetical protein